MTSKLFLQSIIDGDVADVKKNDWVGKKYGRKDEVER